VETLKAFLRRWAILAIVLPAGSCSFSFAESPPIPLQGGSPSAPAPQTRVQIDNAASTSHPDDVQIPEANPARPTISNPAHIPPVGYLQFEQGFLQAGTSSGLAGQFSLVQTMRLSVHPRLMVQFASQPFAYSKLAASPGNAASSQIDTGDLVLGVQGLLIKEHGRRPTVAVGYLHRVRAGSAPDLDIGSFSQSAVVLASGDLGSFHYDGNFNVSEQVEDPVRRAQFGQSLSITHDLFPERLDDKLEISGEIWSFAQPLVSMTRSGTASGRNDAVGTLWALGYTVRPNLVLDGGFERGLTASSTAWQGFAGFTYLLPHRLWGGNETAVGPAAHKHVHRR
jgi:hypothetical protein